MQVNLSNSVESGSHKPFPLPSFLYSIVEMRLCVRADWGRADGINLEIVQLLRTSAHFAHYVIMLHYDIIFIAIWRPMPI
jgi:hypothetical protein